MNIRSLFRFLAYRPGKLIQHGWVLFGWMLLRASAQAITVILLARLMGATSYGIFVAIIATAGFAIPLAGLGLSNIVLRNGARDPDHLPFYVLRGLRIWKLTLLPCFLLAMILAYWLLPNNLPLLATTAAIFLELSASSLTELRARQQQAQHRIGAYGAINAGLPVVRLIALGLLMFFTHQVTLAAALWVYAIASLAYFLFLLSMHTQYLPAEKDLPKEAMPTTSGLPFSMAALAMRLQGEFNKPILAQLGSSLAGNYNIAQRTVDMASLPLLALQEALWPRLYAQPDPMRQLCRTGIALLALATLLGYGVWLMAPLLHWVVGTGYDEAIAALRLVAWLPVLQVGRSLLNFHLIHTERLQAIGWACTLGGIVSILVVLSLVPIYGVLGAVIASYSAEIAMSAFLMYSAIRTQA